MTAQMSEVLVCGEVRNALCSLPLESYLSSTERRAALDGLHRHTACMRGYIGTWGLREGRLFLLGLSDVKGEEIVLNDLFHGLKSPIFASWYSGILSCPQGKRLKYIHDGFRSVYERELLIAVESGFVVSERMHQNSLRADDLGSIDSEDVPDFLKRDSLLRRE